MTHTLLDTLTAIAFFTALGLIVHYFAQSKHYYRLDCKEIKPPRISLLDLLVSFFIFLASAPLTQKIVAKALGIHLTILPLYIASFFLTVILLSLYALLFNRAMLTTVWKKEGSGSESIFYDMKMGLISLAIAIPSVYLLGHLLELFVYLVAGHQEAEQAAILYLKSAMKSPSTFAIALFSIVVGAPVIEEYLFRGLFQNFLRSKLSLSPSLILSSLLFALFHYSPSQSYINISIIGTLSLLGFYLGFVYEKTRSLFAPIVLHVTFNSISVIRIIFTT